MLEVLLTLLLIKPCLTIILPCDFNFHNKDGYSCRVANFTNVDQKAYITEAIGDHFYKTDSFRRRSHGSINTVTMWNMSVHYLPGNLTQVFPSLRILRVKKCEMKRLTRATEFHGLRRIYFGYNEINRVPVNYFWHFCKLEILSLFGNRISDIPVMAFRDLRSLKRLSLNSNRLRSLEPNLFDNCTKLEFVDLDNNLLESIDGQLFNNQPMLTRINLRHNRINSIGNEFLAALPKLEFAMFQNNSCIDGSFPETRFVGQEPLQSIQSIFRDKCSQPVLKTTTSTTTTAMPRTKKPYQPSRVYYYENCEWHAPKGHRYF